MELAQLLPMALGLAWLVPLVSFAAIALAGKRMGRHGIGAGYLATGAIVLSFVLSAVCLGRWIIDHPPAAGGHHAADGHSADSHSADSHAVDSHAEAAGQSEAAPHAAAPHDGPVEPVSGNWYALGRFGSLEITIGYYIDALTVAMFVMVTFIASCIHIYSFGYMHEELHDVTDPQVSLADGLLTRPGRFHRFYQYLSLFCFSMLGLVIAGNVAMVFVFWELVGISSYLLIGFYVERRSASTAANKAFIVNRVGDFGMIIGLMALWSGLGTFAFGDAPGRPGIFSQVRPAANQHRLTVPDGMVRLAAYERVADIYSEEPSAQAAEGRIARLLPGWRQEGLGYGLLIVAGLGIFCGCVGKSAQFPLHVWLPDAMEGPTPVSALIHAATMVAAGVYLVGRFYPAFTPEVLLVIAIVGGITLFIAATIAITATDIKRVLAYSTVSQLGYMMLALGVGGWLAGLFHLFTHAFFKALLFLGSGSVIHACHTNEMTEMGGLRKKLPWTAWTMMIGCLAIAGAGIPLVIGLSGFYSKDAILAQAFAVGHDLPARAAFFWVAAGGAAITAFYMFRMWFLTFAGSPRNEHVYAHAHESPPSMYLPLVALATLAVVAGWTIPGTNLGLVNLLEQARPQGIAAVQATASGARAAFPPAEPVYLAHEHAVHVTVSWIAFGTATLGFAVAVVFYALRWLSAAAVARWLAPVHWFLRNKWFFDEAYRVVFIGGTMALARFTSAIDRRVIDGIANGSARLVRGLAGVDNLIDRYLVDGLVNATAYVTHQVGLRLRPLQSGQLRHYVLMLALGTVTLFIVVSMYWQYAVAGMAGAP